MKRHTALLDLPDELRRYGLNVVAMDGWETAQGLYRWTLPDGTRSYQNPPSGIMFHGTAGTRSVPVVRNRFGVWSKAGAWVGLDDGHGTLYSEPVIGKLNRPTIYLTSAGPARFSAGRGYWPVLTDMFNDVRPPLDAQGPTGLRAANRYTFNVENTHPNDGSRIDDDVFDHLVGLGVVLHQMFGWEERTLGHRSWTRRKPVDPWFTPGGLINLQGMIQQQLQGGIMPPDPNPDFIPAWAVQYWEPYITKYWPGGPPQPSEVVTHYQLAVVLEKLTGLSIPDAPDVAFEIEKVEVVKTVRMI